MEKIQWQISVSIFKNTVVLKQLGIVIGIPFGLVALVDVYKRQADYTSTLTSKPLIPAEQQRVRSVSYTHLDVYKRQVFLMVAGLSF